jgi:hypothetical protein
MEPYTRSLVTNPSALGVAARNANDFCRTDHLGSDLHSHTTCRAGSHSDYDGVRVLFAQQSEAQLTRLGQIRPMPRGSAWPARQVVARPVAASVPCRGPHTVLLCSPQMPIWKSRARSPTSNLSDLDWTTFTITRERIGDPMGTVGTYRRSGTTLVSMKVRSPASLEKYCTCPSIWPCKADRSTVSNLNVASSLSRTGAAVGLSSSARRSS